MKGIKDKVFETSCVHLLSLISFPQFVPNANLFLANISLPKKHTPISLIITPISESRLDDNHDASNSNTILIFNDK